MFSNKQQHGILPTQYHYFYNQGDTIIYPEHIQDLQVIDQMWTNRKNREQHKAQSKNQTLNNINNLPIKKHNKPIISNNFNNNNSSSSGFYNKTYKYTNK
jgi:hypothetical protein